MNTYKIYIYLIYNLVWGSQRRAWEAERAPPRIPGGLWEVLGDKKGSPNALLETTFFTFHGGEFVNVTGPLSLHGPGPNGPP